MVDDAELVERLNDVAAALGGAINEGAGLLADAALDAVTQAATRITALTAEVARKNERIKTLEYAVAQRGMALAPFAEACSNCIDDEPDDASTWEHAVGMEVTFRNFREARAALQPPGHIPVEHVSPYCGSRGRSPPMIKEGKM